MRATLLRTCLPALALSLAATGCNKPPTTCDAGPVVTFILPPNGQSLDTATNPLHVDLDAGTLGITVQVQTFCVAVGSPVTISLDSSLLDGGSLLTIAGDTATVPGIVNLTGDYNGIHHHFDAKVTDLGGKGTAVGVSDVTVFLPPPQEQVSITQPKDGGILSSIQDLDHNAVGLQTQVNFSQKASPNSPIDLCSTIAPPASTMGCPFGGGSDFFIGRTSSSIGMSLLTATLSDGHQTLTAYVLDRLSDAGATSDPVAIEVHTQRPVVTSFTISSGFVDDAGNPWLNSSSTDGGLALGTATVVFGPPDTAIDDAGAQIFDAVTKKLIAFGPLGSSGTTAVVPLSLADGTYPLEVNAKDVWTNPVSDPSLVPPTTSPNAHLTLGVKTSVPTCAIQGPTGFWNVAKNDGGVSDGSVTLPVQIATTNAGATDLAGQPIPGTAAVAVNTVVAATLPVTTSSFTAEVNAPQGVVNLLATITDPAGNPPATCPRTITVDTIPPTITLVPTNPDSMVGGIPTYTSSNNVTISITTDAPTGQQILIFVSSGGGAPNLWNVTGVANGGPTLVTLPALPQGPSAITAQVTDLAGNVGATASPVPVSVAAPGFCSVYISFPPANEVIGSGSGTLAGPNAVTVNFAVETLDATCFGDSVTFTLTPDLGTPVTTTKALDATGKAVFPTTLADAETGHYVATISDGKGTTTPSISYAVKLSLPAIADGGVLPDSLSVEVVAATGNPLVGTTTDAGALVLANSAVDLASAHANFQVSVTGLGPRDSSGNYGSATLQVSFPPPAVTADPTPITIASDPATVSFVDVLLPAHEAGGTVTLTVSDNAQNNVAYTWKVATDVIPPGAPNLTTSITDAHTANIALSWNATGDDGLAGGPVSSYDLRWSTTLNPANDAQFFTGGMQIAPNTPTGHPVGTPETYGLGVPPLNNYFFALRAVDGVGNRSALDPKTVLDPWKTLTLSAPVPTAGTAFGFRVESGDFNGDGATDLVISDPYYSGSAQGDAADGGLVYVLPGQKNDPDLSKLSLGNATVLFSAGIGNRFGYDLAVGDFNGDKTPDLAIGSYASNQGQGLVAIYFGGPNGISSTTPDVTITGAAGSTAQFGRTVRTLKGVGPQGDALFIGEPGTLGGATNTGTGYVFFARTPAAWAALGPPATSANADTTITGASGDSFGFRWGAVAVGDLNSDGKADCILPATASGTIYAFSGATLAGAGALTTAANALFSKTGPMPFPDGTTGFWDSFGASAVSDFFTKGTTQDVVIGDANHVTATLFTTAANKLTSVTALTGNGRFGWVVASADINKDTFPDLLVGRNDTAVGAVSVYLNTKATPFFNQTPDATLSDAANAALGISISTGLYGGAGNGLSIASGTAFSNVLIFYVNPPP